MALTLKMLGQKRDLNGSTYDLCTAVSKAVIVKNISVVNKSTSTAYAFTLSIVPSGGSAIRLTANQVFLAPGAQAIYDEEVTLGIGDKVTAVAPGSSSLDVVAFGLERDV